MANFIKLEEIDGKLHLSGELTFETVDSVLKNNLLSGAEVILIDLAGVSHSDSSGLALLLQWYRQAQSRSARIEFANVPQKMMALAKVSNLDKVLPFVSH